MKLKETSYVSYNELTKRPTNNYICGVDVLRFDSFDEAVHMIEYIKELGVVSVKTLRLIAGVKTLDDEDLKFGWDTTDDWHIDRDYYEIDDEFVINVSKMTIRKNKKFTNTYSLHMPHCRKLTEDEMRKDEAFRKGNRVDY